MHERPQQHDQEDQRKRVIERKEVPDIEPKEMLVEDKGSVASSAAAQG